MTDSVSADAGAPEDLKRGRGKKSGFANELQDRLPPHSTEAESAALGCILMAPSETMEEFALQVKAGVEVFYDLRNQTIYQAMLNLFNAKRPIDMVSVVQELKRMQRLDECGGLPYITTLPDTVPSAANLSYYTEVLNEKYVLRRILRMCGDFSQKVYDYSGTHENLLDLFERDSLGIRQSIEQGRDLADVPAIQKELMHDYEEAMHHQKRPGISTGFEELDRIVGGLQPQDLILVGASPSSGKTSLALNIAEHAILEQGLKVGIISLETSTKKLLHRVNCSLARVDGSRFMCGAATADELNRLVRQSSKSGKITRFGQNVMISDRGNLSVTQAAGIFRVMYKNGARLFILDYLQLLTSGQRNVGRRVEEMTLVSTGLKGIAKDLNCPVIVVCSINRDPEKENRPPRMADLRDSGQLEFDADKGILLHRKDNDDETRTVSVNVAKNKDGRTASTDLIFIPPELRFCSPDKINDEDVPKPATLL